MADLDVPGRFSYKARGSVDPASRASNASKARNAFGVAELLAKSRVEQHRHQQNLRRLPHPDFAATPISSITTSTSYPLPPSPFPLAASESSPTTSPNVRSRSKKPPGPSAPASWSPIIPDRPLAASSSSRHRRDPEEVYQRRRGEYELWFRYAYAGEGKGKQSELIGRDLSPAFARAWLEGKENVIATEDPPQHGSVQDHDRVPRGAASLQSHAIASFTRYALEISPGSLDSQPRHNTRTSENGPVTDERDDESEDALAYIRAVAPLLTDERRISMMLSRAGTYIMRKRSSEIKGGTRLEGILGIWSGWQDVVDPRSKTLGGHAQSGERKGRQAVIANPDMESGSDEGDSDDEQDSRDDAAGQESEDDDDWDRSSGSREDLAASHGLKPLPILDLSYIPTLSNAETKLLRSVLHSTSAYTWLTRLSFAGSGIILSDALNLLPLPGGTRVRPGLPSLAKDGGPTSTSRALRLTHLSLAGMQSRDGKELERAVGKLTRLGSELEMLDLSEIGVFQSFGLWAILGALFDPDEASGVAGEGSRTGGKMPALKVVGLKGLLPSYVLAGGADIEDAVRTYRAYVTARRPRKWVDLVFM